MSSLNFAESRKTPASLRIVDLFVLAAPYISRRALAPGFLGVNVLRTALRLIKSTVCLLVW